MQTGGCSKERYSILHDQRQLSHIRIATKYPETTKRYFAEKGVQVDCINLTEQWKLLQIWDYAEGLLI